MQQVSRRGSNAVELALVLPVLLALMTGVMDYGWILLHQHLAGDAAAAGVRAGGVAQEDEDASALAMSATNDRWDAFALPTDVQVTVTEAASRIEVEVRVPNVRLVGFVPAPGELVVVRSRVIESAL